MTDGKILLIGDNPAELREFRRTLIDNDFDVSLALGDQDAFELATQKTYDLNIVDLNFIDPQVDVLSFCRKLRDICQSPIFVLADGGNEDIRKTILSSAADGFLEKPFSTELFMAHVRAKLRLWSSIRGNDYTENRSIDSKEICIDPIRHEVRVRNKVVHLTPKEFAMLYYLARNEGRVVKHMELANVVWDVEYTDTRRYLRAIICNIRKKIEKDPKSPKHILTEPGLGYRFYSEGVDR